MSKKSKYYRDAYNNPGQYDLSKLNANSPIVKDIAEGVTDAAKDRANGTYKFK